MISTIKVAQWLPLQCLCFSRLSNLTASINTFHLEFFSQNGPIISEKKPREKIRVVYPLWRKINTVFLWLCSL